MILTAFATRGQHRLGNYFDTVDLKCDSPAYCHNSQSAEFTGFCWQMWQPPHPPTHTHTHTPTPTHHPFMTMRGNSFFSIILYVALEKCLFYKGWRRKSMLYMIKTEQKKKNISVLKFKIYLSFGRIWPRGSSGHRVLPLEESFPSEQPESSQSRLCSLWGLRCPATQRASRATFLPGIAVYHPAAHIQCQPGNALRQQHQYVAV